MDSVGAFREREIDGKPFHIFSFLPQPSSSSSSSDLGGDRLYLESLQPRFICPWSRFHNDPWSRIVPYHASPHFPITTINDHCKLPLLPIFWCNNKEPNYKEFKCGACFESDLGTSYYICVECSWKFHKECVETPLEIQIPSFPFLSFQLYNSLSWGDASCIRCKLEIYGMYYHCSTNKFSMHSLCAMKPIDILIDYPKRHPHTLTFFPKQSSLRCDVCGLVNESFPTYVCLRSIFVVHEDCIYLPFVIKISRHPHRISFIYSLPSGNWSCGVCRRKVDNRFGVYSCNKCNEYFVHSKCAVRKDVWDGKELEGIPEEPEEIVEPFVKIDDGIIHHFLHGHHLKLEVIKVYNDYTICQACVLPVYEGNYYFCLDGCDFVIHEICASAARKIHHPLHAHPLILKPPSGEMFAGQGYFNCYACLRVSCGFVYEVGDYMLDVRCASVSEPFEYQGHEHPLYLSLDPTQECEATCRICRHNNSRKLSCIECDYVICLWCATRPYKAKYKHDEHFLTFQEGKEGSDVFDWCEVCEKKIEYSSGDGFYACDHCCTTLHVSCLLGDHPYMMKPGQAIKVKEKDVHIISNNTQSRPLCHYGGKGIHLCPQKVVFKRNEKSQKTYCSLDCCHN